MPRIPAIATTEAAPAAARPMLDAVRRRLGRIPNLLRVLARSPAALQGYLALDTAQRKSTIAPETQERIALAVAELSRCDYGLSAHAYAARHAAKLDDAEITANRNGASNCPVADAAVRLAAQLARTRGAVSDAELAAFKAAGYSDAQAIEIAVLVALHTLTSTVNNLAQTDIDFPVVTARPAA
jgi:uncharacterized peroxidase-related enzyme